MAELLEGKPVAEAVLAKVATDVAALAAAGTTVGLATVLVGEDPGSVLYIRSKKRACRRVGIASPSYELPATTTEAELLALVAALNADRAVHGILVQLPLPPHIDEDAVIRAIAPEKDVDGFHPENVGLVALGQPRFVPCTPKGVIAMLDHYGVALEGRRAVVIGRSRLVGRPVALLLLQRNATVTVCHSKTVDLPARVAEADIVVAAIGRPEMVRGDWIRPGATVVDVGINRLPDGRVVGDVAFEEAAIRAARLTPVPGGVGPMTIAMLLRNTTDAAAALACP